MSPREQSEMLLRKAAADEALAIQFIRQLRVWVEAELNQSGPAK